MPDTIHYCKDCAEADTTLGAYRLWKCLASKYPNLVAGGSLFKTCEEARAFYAIITDKNLCNHFKALEEGGDDGEGSDSAGDV